MSKGEIHKVANKYHFDNGAKFREMPDKDAVRLEIGNEGGILIWIPKSVCRWDVNKRTGDVHMYIKSWWYDLNEEQFEV